MLSGNTIGECTTRARSNNAGEYNHDMETSIAARLLDLNRQFYQTFGGEFSATRGRIQPGVRRVLETLRGDEIILDLGCGNGELARALARRGHRGSYTGLDFSLPLLKEAERHLEGSTAKFLQADLTSPDWENVIARGEAPTLAPAASAGEQSHVTSSPEIASSGFDTVRAASNGGTPVRDGRLSTSPYHHQTFVGVQKNCLRWVGANQRRRSPKEETVMSKLEVSYPRLRTNNSPP